MGEAFRHEELIAPLGADLDGHMLAIARRALADVDDDIEDGAPQHADELALGMGRLLEMQAANRSGRAGEGDIVLHEMAVEAGGGEGPGIVPFAEIAAPVAEATGLVDPDIGESGRNDFHAIVPVR